MVTVNTLLMMVNERFGEAISVDAAVSMITPPARDSACPVHECIT